jgi:hypothetical protein
MHCHRDGLVLEEEEDEVPATTCIQVLDEDVEAAARPEGIEKGLLKMVHARKSPEEKMVTKPMPTSKMKESNKMLKKRRLRRGEHLGIGQGDSSSESEEIVPKRRLKLDAASKQSGKVQPAPKLAPRPSSTRAAQIRLLKRYDHFR